MSHNSRIVGLVLGLALLLRLGMAIAVDRHVQSAGRQFLIEGDANGYWELGTRLAAGQDYCVHQPPRYVLRTPGFPLLLAACIRVFGESVFAASLVLAGVGTLCVWLTWVLARRCVSEPVALLAAGLAAVSPLQVGNSVLILSETWFAVGVLLSLLSLEPLLAGVRDSAIQECGDDVSPRRHPAALMQAVVCGVITGLSVLVRPGWILWAGVASLLIMVFGHGTAKQRVGRSILLCAGCLLALFPWAARNDRVTGHWVWTSLWSGPSLYDGLHPGATGASDMDFVDREQVFSTMTEYDANAHYKQRAVEFVLQNPKRSLQLAWIKAGRYLSLTPNAAGFSGGPVSLVCLVFYVFLCLLLAAGCWSLRRRRALLALLTAPFLQFLLVHMVFVGSVRYRLPVEFPLMILASAGGWALWTQWRSAPSEV